MTTKQVTISPPNSIILVMDHQAGVVPDTLGRKLVAATPTCVAVGTLAELDGETTVVLTDQPVQDLAKGDVLVFDGTIAVPSKELSVVTALDQKLVSIPIDRDDARLRVWTNDPTEPSHIVVGVS